LENVISDGYKGFAQLSESFCESVGVLVKISECFVADLSVLHREENTFHGQQKGWRQFFA
jgi:hypothetical protein